MISILSSGMQLPADVDHHTQMRIFLHLQICQIPNFDPTSSYDIADGNEQIMIDPSDSRGQVYLQYSGPGDNGGSPRYMEL